MHLLCISHVLASVQFCASPFVSFPQGLCSIMPPNLLKFAKPAFLRRPPPWNQFFLWNRFFFSFAPRNLNGRPQINFFFLRLFFQFAFTNKTVHPIELSMHTK